MSQITVLSAGGGLQSTALALMAMKGEIEKPDVMFHMDTGSEMPHTVETIDRLFKLANENGIRSEIITAPEGRLFEWYMEKGWIPRPRNGACTYRFKIAPLRRKLKKMIDQSLPKPWITNFIGITTDEAHRARKSDVQWIELKYPLIELGLSRSDCREWMNDNYSNWEVKKSGCFHCHYQPSSEWIKLRRDHPELFALSRKMEDIAKESGNIKYGLFGGKTIAVFDHTHTLDDFGFTFMAPEEYNCDSAQAGCFL